MHQLQSVGLWLKWIREGGEGITEVVKLFFFSRGQALVPVSIQPRCSFSGVQTNFKLCAFFLLFNRLSLYFKSIF